ncbi:MAG: sugar phosphate isomerase/epimerase [Planctomycetaceae bacterium]|nr:sugar phosphate isomerase/epimerase [Planctomycetaceae bacterium]
MNVSRRGFLAGGAACAAGAAWFCPSAGADEPADAGDQGQTASGPAQLKLSSQLGIIPGKDLAEKLANMERWGFDAVELDGDIVGHEKKYEDAIKETNLKCSAICWGSHKGALVSDIAEERKAGVEALKKVLTSAGALGSTGVIYVPAFNSDTKRTNQEIRKTLLDIMPAIGDHAVKAGTRVILEPLNRKEAFFLRQVADAASIARDCESPGICVMGDFFHMTIEETSDLGAFISGGSRVHHVHLASRTRHLPGQDERQFIEGFRGLKQIGYQDYCSFECSVNGNPKVEIPKSMAFLRQQWAKA